MTFIPEAVFFLENTKICLGQHFLVSMSHSSTIHHLHAQSVPVRHLHSHDSEYHKSDMQLIIK